jgi:prophage maintenance system killer protein
MFINANKRTAVFMFSYFCMEYNFKDKSDNELFDIVQKIVKNKFNIEYSKILLFK